MAADPILLPFFKTFVLTLTLKYFVVVAVCVFEDLGEVCERCGFNISESTKREEEKGSQKEAR